jgi:multiple sugar transport system substrate-binding protein
MASKSRKTRAGKPQGITRREAVKAAGAGALGAAALLAGAGAGLFGGKAPAFAQGTTLNALHPLSFIPEIDDTTRTLAEEFGKQAGVKMNMEFIDQNGLLPRVVAGVESKAGPDIYELQWNTGWLFGNAFADVGDLVQALGGKKLHAYSLDAVHVDGVYRGVPLYCIASAMTYNKKICDPLGITKYANTYDELRAIGRKLKQAGKPIGWCLGHTVGDGAFGNYPILWSYGGAEVDEKGRVIINSPGTREALKFMKAFWTEACDENGMAWNDASNNQAYLAENVGAVLNAASIYIKLRRDERAARAKGDTAGADHWGDLANNTRHTVAPKGPKGRYELVQQYSYHVASYSPNVKLAKDYVRYVGLKPNYERLFLAGQGFALGISSEWDHHPFWKKDPLLEPFNQLSKYGRNMGFHGSYNRKASEVQAKYIIADMFARGIQQDVESAVKWAEGELKLVYAEKA